jgi:hypothetical protein
MDRARGEADPTERPVAILTARRGDLTGVSDLFGFIEYLYVVLCLYLGAYGAGPLSLDAVFATRFEAAERPLPARAVAAR